MIDQASIDAIAYRVVELLRDEGNTKRVAHLIDAAEVARRFSVSKDYVYDHSADLGAVRLGVGPKAHLRFDPDVVAERLAPRPDPRAIASAPTTPRRQRRGVAVDLLPIRREP
jgi:hypothetical protein